MFITALVLLVALDVGRSITSEPSTEHPPPDPNTLPASHSNPLPSHRIGLHWETRQEGGEEGTSITHVSCRTETQSVQDPSRVFTLTLKTGDTPPSSDLSGSYQGAAFSAKLRCHWSDLHPSPSPSLPWILTLTTGTEGNMGGVDGVKAVWDAEGQTVILETPKVDLTLTYGSTGAKEGHVSVCLYHRPDPSDSLGEGMEEEEEEEEEDEEMGEYERRLRKIQRRRASSRIVRKDCDKWLEALYSHKENETATGPNQYLHHHHHHLAIYLTTSASPHLAPPPMLFFNLNSRTYRDGIWLGNLELPSLSLSVIINRERRRNLEAIVLEAGMDVKHESTGRSILFRHRETSYLSDSKGGNNVESSEKVDTCQHHPNSFQEKSWRQTLRSEDDTADDQSCPSKPLTDDENDPKETEEIPGRKYTRDEAAFEKEPEESKRKVQEIRQKILSEGFNMEANMTTYATSEGGHLVEIHQLSEVPLCPRLGWSLNQVFHFNRDWSGWEYVVSRWGWGVMVVRGQWGTSILQHYRKTFTFSLDQACPLPSTQVMLDFSDARQFVVGLSWPVLATTFTATLTTYTHTIHTLSVVQVEEYSGVEVEVVRVVSEDSPTGVTVAWTKHPQHYSHILSNISSRLYQMLDWTGACDASSSSTTTTTLRGLLHLLPLPLHVHTSHILHQIHDLVEWLVEEAGLQDLWAAVVGELDTLAVKDDDDDDGWLGVRWTNNNNIFIPHTILHTIKRVIAAVSSSSEGPYSLPPILKVLVEGVAAHVRSLG